MGIVFINVQETNLSFGEVTWLVETQQLMHAESGLQVRSNLEVQVHRPCAILGGFYITAHHLLQSIRLNPGKRIRSGEERPKGACASCIYLREALSIVTRMATGRLEPLSPKYNIILLSKRQV